MIYEYNPNLKLLKQVCNKFDFSGNNCRNIANFVPIDLIKTDKIEEIEGNCSIEKKQLTRVYQSDVWQG